MAGRIRTTLKRVALAVWDIACGLAVEKAVLIGSICLAILLVVLVYPIIANSLGEGVWPFVRLVVRIAGSFGWKLTDSVALNIIIGFFHVIRVSGESV